MMRLILSGLHCLQPQSYNWTKRQIRAKHVLTPLRARQRDAMFKLGLYKGSDAAKAATAFREKDMRTAISLSRTIRMFITVTTQVKLGWKPNKSVAA
jgi:hypothetical protein